MLTIYRVEHRDLKCGPYNYSKLYDIMEADDPRLYDMSYFVTADLLDYEHPVPSADGIAMVDSNVCGFRSLAQLLRWFSQEALDVLIECDYVINVYSVPPHLVQVGRYQVMFPRDSMASGTIAIDDLPLNVVG